MYRHIVMFRLHDGVGTDAIEAAQRSLRGLAVFPEVVSLTVERSLDERKGIIVVEDATFADRDAFAVWHAREEHAHAANQMSRVADWWVADYVD